MAIEVLKKRIDNLGARAEMRRRGLDCLTPWFSKFLHKMRVVRGVNVGLLLKSWDVLQTLNFIEQHVEKSAPILDLGAYGSEILCGLYRMGFSDLTGIDLNPALSRMPHNETIKYVTGNFMSTAFPDSSFGVVTAISVLEHGFCGAKIFAEASRILRPGGYFVGSTDYWPRKIDTTGIIVYGLDWTIFSRDELLTFVEEAGKYGLAPVGRLDVDASETTVRWQERDYTFAWFALRKMNCSSRQGE